MKTIYIVIGILVAVALFLGLLWYQKYYGVNYTTAKAVELNDKCATPSGYTDEAWRQHMSHHPDQYRECLGG